MGKEEKRKKRKLKRIRVIESDLARTQISPKKHEEWCCDHLHFVKKEQEKGGRNGGPGGAKRGCRGKQEALGARHHWLSGGPVRLMTSLHTTFIYFNDI
jgi:hypothetical protein